MTLTKRGDVLKTFYQFMMSYRGKKRADDYSRLADWMFADPDFPKQETNYNILSNYLEWLSPFPGSLSIFDEVWEVYELKNK